MIELIERFGVLGVFLLMVPESACVPVPSEVTLLFSGFAVHQGWMSFPLAVLAATAGNLVGSLLAYALGATRALQRLPLAGTVIGHWEGLLDRHIAGGVHSAALAARPDVRVAAGRLETRRAGPVRCPHHVRLRALGCWVCARWAGRGGRMDGR
jgi:hypothetical protein